MRELFKDNNFQITFSTNKKSENYKDLPKELIQPYRSLGCSISYKLRFLHSYQELFLNLGAVLNKNGKKF